MPASAARTSLLRLPAPGLAPALAVALALAPALSCGARSDEGGAPARVWVALGGETFDLELARTPAERQRGLSGRARIPRNGGMLFVFPRPQPLSMVMRDCPAPIDVAFLDAAGRVVAVHEMSPEPPRRPGEGALDYERRLPVYPSGAPAQFAIETAGGRLRQLGIAPGERVALDFEGLARDAK
jgi:uncharacterized membrane protein (UPF0127 family)